MTESTDKSPSKKPRRATTPKGKSANVSANNVASSPAATPTAEAAAQASPGQPQDKVAEPPPEPTFSLGRFESNCYARKHEVAAQEFLALLGMLDRNYGALDNRFKANPTADLGGTDQDPHIINRICSALSALFSDPSFNLSVQGFRQMLFLHRWIATLFAASSFRNADHILRALNLNGPDSSEVRLKHEDIIKFCMLYTPNSEIPLNLDALWAYNKNLTAALGCALITPRFLGTIAAHSKRETLLRWLPDKLDEIEDLDILPTGVIHDVYMHCSYADLPGKHAIKAPINRLVRKKLEQLGLEDVDIKSKRRKKGEKPIMLVVLEWFSMAHAMYRCYAPLLIVTKEHFHTIGVGGAAIVDEAGRNAFHEFIEINHSDVIVGTGQIRAIADERRPDFVYYPSIGMFPITIFTSNLRLAPVQMMTFGHPATSLSEFIDYRINETGYAGADDCFSEKLIALPNGVTAFAKSPHYVKLEPVYRDNPDVVKIVITASSMKFNPGFLSTCRTIQNQAKNPVEFHIMMGMSHGLVYLEARNFVYSFLPAAKIYPMQDYVSYLKAINQCDMFLNPFPFGNTNGIVDVASQNLVGVCRTGPETHSCIDEFLFRRLEYPEWLIARNNEEYIDASLKLINDHKLRIDIRLRLKEMGGVEHLFIGNPKVFAEAISNNFTEPLSSYTRSRGAISLNLS